MPLFATSWRRGVTVGVVGAGAGYYAYDKQRGMGRHMKSGERSRMQDSSAWDARLSADIGDQHSTVTGAHGERIVLWAPPPRAEVKQRMQQEEFDLLVIGGGAVGAGVAMDAQLRGMKVALVEAEDFASGTSSRSTKLIHGGIRYLLLTFQKKLPTQFTDLFNNLTFNQANYDVVKSDLYERAYMIESAPFMTTPLPMLIPMYKWWEVPMMIVGGLMYDWVAGSRRTVPSCQFFTQSQALYAFPNMRDHDVDGNSLKGATVLYDGQHNDTRMNLLIALTAMQGGRNAGASMLNHCKVTRLLTNGKGPSDKGFRVTGAAVEETVSDDGPGQPGDAWEIRAKQVINATGPWADAMRKMADPKAKEIIVPAKGSHLIVPDYFSPDNMGFIRMTSDGRVLYFLPWENQTIVGTTDAPDSVTRYPLATEQEIDFCIREANGVLREGVQIDREQHVRAAWAGLRPLVRDPSADPNDTKKLARDHVVDVIGGPQGLLSICGGKWTTYRRMAKDVIDRAVQDNPLLDVYRHVPCVTGLRADGSQHTLLGSDRQGLVTGRFFGNAGRLNVLLREHYDMSQAMCHHLIENYGTRALVVAQIAHQMAVQKPDFADLGQLHYHQLHPKYPNLDAEVVYACRHECAVTAVDVLARRTRLAFLNARAARSAMPKVLDIMQDELAWSAARRAAEEDAALQFIRTMQDARMSTETVAPAAAAGA